MSTPTMGQCCVCGEKTTARCGACEQAGFDLFFCSREHQKLIWPFHKRVCGPGKANPFVWPPFSVEEVEEAKKVLQTDATFSDFCTRVAKIMKMDDPATFLDSLLLEPFSLQSHPNIQFLVCTLRSQLASALFARWTSIPAEERPAMPLALVLPQATHWATVLDKRFFLSGGPDEPDPPTPSWLSAILHQLVVVAAIFVQISAEKWTDEERTAIYRYWDESQDVLREQVVRLVLPTHPRQAADFLKWMRSERSEGEQGGTAEQ